VRWAVAEVQSVVWERRVVQLVLEAGLAMPIARLTVAWRGIGVKRG